MTVVVTAVVLPQPILAVSSGALNFYGSVGETNIARLPVGISNAGSGTLVWMASGSDPRLSVSPTSGVGDGTVSVGIDVAGLTPGVWRGTVTISALGAGASPVAIPVTLTLSAPVSVTASASPISGGAVTGGGIFAKGATVRLEATPAAGNEFVNWTSNGQPAAASSIYSFVATANTVLIANFRPLALSITTASNPATAGSTSGGGSVNSGATVTVVGTANSGYSFSNWTENGNLVSSVATYTFVAATNRSLVANFQPTAPTAYTVATSAIPVAGGTTSGGGTFSTGSTATVTATASAGFTFVDWSENGAAVATSATYTFPVTGNRTLVANFSAGSPVMYTAMTSVNPTGGGVASGSGTYAAGSSVTVTAVANPGFAFSNWSEGGVVVSSSEFYSFTIGANRTLVASFVQSQNVTISTSVSPASSGYSTGGRVVTVGTSVTVGATPQSSGYTFGNWTENGVIVSTSAQYTFIATTSRNLVANFNSSIIVWLGPQDYPLVGDTLTVTADVTSGAQIASAVATVAGRQTTLVRNSAGNWGGSLDLSGLPRDTLNLVVVASDVNGLSGSGSRRYIHDRAPRVLISSPVDADVARPSFTYSATCIDDDPAGCVSFTLVARSPAGSSQTLASGTASLSGTVSLAAFDGSRVTLAFVGKDARGQVKTVTQSIYVESSNQLSPVGVAGGLVLDVSGGRALYGAPASGGPPLGIRTLATGADEAVVLPPVTALARSFITPFGAITAGNSTLYDWRSGSLYTVPGISTAPQVSGGYAIWEKSVLVNGSNVTTLFRRDLTTGADVTVATGTVNNIYNSVASDGSVAYTAYRDRGGQISNVFWYRSGVPVQVTNDSLVGASSYWPQTDGVNVVFLRSLPQGKVIVLSNGISEAILTPPQNRTTGPLPGDDWTVNGGWTAFTITDANNANQLWTRSPTGTISQVSQFAASSVILALGTDGSVVFRVGGRQYLAAPGATPRDVASAVGTVIWRNGQFLDLIGRTVWRILP